MGKVSVVWKNNNSKRFDGKEQAISDKLIVEKDTETLKIGSNIVAKFGRKFWNGVVSKDVENTSFLPKVKVNT